MPESGVRISLAVTEWTQKLQLRPSLTGPTDGAAVVGFERGVDAVGGGAVADAAVHFPVGLAAAALTPGHLHRRIDGVTEAWIKCRSVAFLWHQTTEKEKFSLTEVHHFAADKQLIAGISTASKLPWFQSNMRQEAYSSQ